MAASVGDGIQHLIEIAQKSCHNFRRESTRGAYSLACFSASLASPRASLAAPLALSATHLMCSLSMDFLLSRMIIEGKRTDAAVVLIKRATPMERPAFLPVRPQ